MPRRSILSTAERQGLLALPDDSKDLIRHYTLSESDLSVIRQHRGAANRLGFAVQLCYMRYPGVILGRMNNPPSPLLWSWWRRNSRCAGKLGRLWPARTDTPGTSGRTASGVRLPVIRHAASYGSRCITWTTSPGKPTRESSLAGALVQNLRRQSILLPSINVIERICAEAITRASRRIQLL